MFPLPFPPPRPTTPTSLPPIAPILSTLYNSLLRPTLLPPPAAFTQPLLDQFIENHDPLLENQDIFTVGGRLREVGVAVEGIGREFRRRGEESVVVQDGVNLEAVREGRLRCRLGNQMGCGNRLEKQKIIASAKERMEAFEKEIKRQEEEELKLFKEGLRRAVGGG